MFIKKNVDNEDIIYVKNHIGCEMWIRLSHYISCKGEFELARPTEDILVEPEAIIELKTLDKEVSKLKVVKKPGRPKTFKK